MLLLSFVKNRVGGGLGMAGDLSKMFRALENSSLCAKMGVEAGGGFLLDHAMKKIALALLIAVAAGCAPAPVIPVPDAAMAAKSGDKLPILQKGYGVYMAQCSRCHEPMMPSKVSEDDWHIVTPGMAWNAGISEADEAAVLKYILAAKQ
jgi:hypothetical protein